MKWVRAACGAAPPWGPRPGSTWIGPLLLRLLLAWLAGAMPAMAGARDAPAPQELREAEFATSAAGPWTRVTLPDTWSQRGVARPAMGWYRWRVTLPTPPGARREGQPAADSTLWALRADRLGSRHRLWLNGALLHDSFGEDEVGRAQALPLLLQLPPALLRPGDSQMLLQVDSGLRAGLSPLRLGPATAMALEHRISQNLSVALPQQLNLAAAGACGFALLMWWRRRSEAAMGWFGLLGLGVSLRNQAYYVVNPGLPPALTSALFFATQVGTVVALGMFAMSLTRRRPRGYRPLLLGGGAAMVLLGVAAGVWSGTAALDRLRTVAYPLLGALALPALVLIAQRVRAMRGGELAALLASLVVVMVAGAHDYRFQQGHLAITEHWWLPLATPLMVLAFAVLMVGRMAQAMSQVEVLNLTLEQRVRERTHALATATAAKSRFLAAASHDLRQPVVTIGLLVSLLREQLVAPAQRHMVAKVDEAVAAMEALLARLLDLSRLDSGTVRVRLQQLALQPLFDAVAVHEGEAARQKGLLLRVRPTALAVRADAALLEQILRNLVSNAVRYTDAGGLLLAARRAADGQVRLQVWDSGRGIPAHQQAAVFEEFVQLDNPQRDRAQGLGLGLAIVQRSADLMGATLGLRSVPGRGSCFSLLLPGAAAPEDGTTPSVAPALRWLAGRHLVLVDDDSAVREALSARLQAWGASVAAFDGPRALRAALDALPPGERRADLLITDLRLPGGSGFDVVALARRRFGQLPVLVVTGNTAPADIAALGDSGLAVLHKPFRAEQLRAAINEALAAPAGLAGFPASADRSVDTASPAAGFAA